MARKSRKADKLKQELISSVPVEQRKMITQPINFTYLTGEMSMMQTRIQTMIMEQLQGKIKKAIEKKAKDGFVGDLFDSDDYKPISPDDRSKYLTFKVAYSELGIEPAHYNDVDVAARAMQSIVYEKETSDGKMRYIVAFPVVDIDKDIPGKRRQNIYLHMTESTAKDLFNITPYHRYLKDAIFLFSSNYAGRIYLLINANKQLGTWKISYEKLRKILLTTYDKETKKATVDKYRDINDFKKRVLEPARKEILEAADRIDCTFDYEFQYPAGKKRGTPEFIIFHIHITDLGRNIKQAQLESQETTELRKLLLTLGLNVTEANRLMKDAWKKLPNPAVLLTSKANELKRKYADIKAGRIEGKSINDPHTYSLTTFRNFITEYKVDTTDFTPAEEIKSDQENKTSQSGKNPAQANEQGGGVATHDGCGYRVKDGLTADELKAFQAMLLDLRKATINNKAADLAYLETLLSHLVLDGVNDAARLIRITALGESFNDEFTIPYYWSPADFANIVAAHFNGYGYRIY